LLAKAGDVHGADSLMRLSVLLQHILVDQGRVLVTDGGERPLTERGEPGERRERGDGMGLMAEEREGDRRGAQANQRQSHGLIHLFGVQTPVLD
jgi:hypothetical protein